MTAVARARQGTGSGGVRFGALFGAMVAVFALALAAPCWARPNVLRQKPVASPDEKRGANAEWENVGYMGVLRVVLYDGRGKQTGAVEVPQVNPMPASIDWLGNDWVVCSSFLGPNAAGFLYVHAPTQKGYLIEIVDPRKDGTWQLSYAVNDSAASGTIATVAVGKESIFPVTMRDLPADEGGYLSEDFAVRLKASLEAYLDWRRREGIQNLDILSEAAIRPGRGGVVAVAADGKLEAVYFRTMAPDTAGTLSSVKRQPMAFEDKNSTGPARLPVRVAVEWLAEPGTYRAAAELGAGRDRLVAHTGKFEGVTDEAVPTEDGATTETKDKADRDKDDDRKKADEKKD